MRRKPDFGYDTRTPLKRMLDEEHKAKPGIVFRSGYLSIIGENPDAGPCDFKTAKTRLFLIDRAIDTGGWTSNEWGRLYAMREKWRLRVEGRDPRYVVRGNRPGKATTVEQRYIDLHKAVRAVLKLAEKFNEKSEA